MTIQPGGRRGRLRASHADREHVIDALKVAFVQGRLTKDEFDTRVAQTLAARTYADLSALTVDIPAGLTGLRPEPVPARPAPQPGRQPMSNAAKAGLSVVIAFVVLVVLTAVFGGAGFGLCVAFYLMASLVAGSQALYSRQQRRTGGQLPPSRRSLQAGPPRLLGQALEDALGQPRPDETRPDETRADETRADLRGHRPARRPPAIPLPVGSYG